MTYPHYLRTRARQLRIDRRLSIDELVERLALPRTTIYEWVKDLLLARPRSTAGQAKGTAAMQAKYKRLREEAYAQGVAEFETLAARLTFIDFVVLYIAEGYKRNRTVVSIANSDPAVTRLATRWLRSLTLRPLAVSVQYHADQDLSELRKFWGDMLGFDGQRLRAQRKSNSNQLTGRSWRSVHGVLTVAVSDTPLRARLQAWIDLVKASWRLDSGPATGRGAAW